MGFGIGNLFNLAKMPNVGTTMFGGPTPSPASANGSSAIGSPSWGQLNPPGAPPTPPISGLQPPPNGLLRSGDEDFQGPGMPGGTNAAMPQLVKAGGENAVGAPRGLSIMPPAVPTPGNPGAASGGPGLHPTEPPMGPLAPSAPSPSTFTPPPGTTTPSQSPQYTPTPPVANEPPGAARRPYDIPAAPAAAPPAAGGGSATPTAGQTAAGGGFTSKLGDVGKALSGAGGQGAEKGYAPGHAPGGVGAANTPNGASLLAEIMKAHAPPNYSAGAGPVPGLPQGLLSRRRG